MTSKPVKRSKHIPQRTCVGCREVLPKRTLIRLVRSQEGVLVDQTGKLAGRGAYLHNSRVCWEKGLKGSLARALKTELSPVDLERLTEYLKILPDNDETTET